MKLTTLLTLAAAGAITITSASAQRVFGDGTLPEKLAPYDVDGDGQLSVEERQAFKAARKEARGERRAKVLEQFDADGDGKLNQEEREAAREAHRARIEAKRQERFAEADTDKNGSLSLEEFSAIPPVARRIERRENFAQRVFDRMDKNDNGTIEADEFTDHLRKPKRGPRRGGPGRPGPGGDTDRPE